MAGPLQVKPALRGIHRTGSFHPSSLEVRTLWAQHGEAWRWGDTPGGLGKQTGRTREGGHVSESRAQVSGNTDMFAHVAKVWGWS